VRPQKAILGDLNGELVEVYGTLRAHASRVHAQLSTRPPDSATYYHLRALRPADLTAFDRTVRFVYLNRFCFNGIFRTNRRGQFNVPFSGDKTGGLPPLASFKLAAGLLKKAKLRAGDFGRILTRTKPGQFVYLDPPYSKPSRRYRGEYGPKTFSPKDLARLKAHLIRMAARGVKFVLSYEDSAGGRKLASEGWNVRRVLVRRNVSGFAGQRRRASELIISNIDIKKGRTKSA
jgi:DNA adenine methylase